MRRSIEKTLLCLLLAAISVFGVELKWTAVGDVKRILTDGEHEGFRLSALGEAITAPMPPLDWLGVFRLSCETRGVRARGTVVFWNLSGEICGQADFYFPASVDLKEFHTDIKVPERAVTGSIRLQAAVPGVLDIGDSHIEQTSRASIVDDRQWRANPEAFKPKLKGRTEFPKCRVVRHNGVSCLEVDGKIVNPVHFWASHPQELQARNAAEAGFDILAVDVYQGGFYENGYDFRNMDELLEFHIDKNPDVKFILYVNFDGRFHKWWIRRHPEVLCRLEDGSDTVCDHNDRSEHFPSFGSSVWREAFAEHLRLVIRHLADSPYAERVLAFHVVSGISYEWLTWGSQSNQLTDYSEGSKEDFRLFLKRRYGTVEALRSAWRNLPDVTFETAAIPSASRRLNAANGRIYDALLERDVIDYNEYQSEVISRCIIGLGKVIKEETGGRSLCGAFFGYTVNQVDLGFFGQNCGHLDVRDVLDSPYVDYLISPVAYSGRQPGDTTVTMTASWSCTVNNKIFFNHADFRTQWAPKDDYSVDSLSKSIDVLYRELARNMAEGNPFQIYDFSRGWTMGDKRLADVVKHCRELNGVYRLHAKDFPKKDYLLVVIDEEGVAHYQIDSPALDRELVYYQMMNLTMAGIPWRVVLFSDLMKHRELQDYNAYLFLNLFKINDLRKKFLQGKILCGGRLAAFMGPVGLISPDGLSTKAAEELFGRPFRLDTKPLDMRCKATALWKSIEGVQWGTTDGKLYSHNLLPRNMLDKETVARLLDGTPSAFYNDDGQFKLFWSAAPGLKPPVIRELARRGGVPVVASQNDGIYAGCGFVGIHAASDGVKEIHLIGGGRPRDIITGEVWPHGTSIIRLPMRLGETRIFVME